MRKRAGSALAGVRGLGVGRAPGSVVVARAVASDAGELVDATTGKGGRSPAARAAGSGVALRWSWPGAPSAALRGAGGGGDDGVCTASGENAISTTSQPSAASAACVRSTAGAVALTIGACALASA